MHDLLTFCVIPHLSIFSNEEIIQDHNQINFEAETGEKVGFRYAVRYKNNVEHHGIIKKKKCRAPWNNNEFKTTN